MDFASPTALLERLLTAKREVVFLVGAPLTAPTGSSGLGVPGVAAMVDRIRAMFQSRPRIAREPRDAWEIDEA